MDFSRKYTTKASQETAAIGQSLAKYLTSQRNNRGEIARLPRMICLYGELGSGKTTLASGFAKGLGITSRLLSPTFIIVRRYNIPKSQGFLYHLDLYRINNTAEIGQLGLSDMYHDPASFVIVEWAEKLGEMLPARRIDVRFNLNPDGTHHIQLEEATRKTN